MGFLDYAWSLSFQKDRLKTGISLDSKLNQPKLALDQAHRYHIVIPEPIMLENETPYFLGYRFSHDFGKTEVGRLFRACIYHLTAHTLIPIEEQATLSNARSTTLESFASSIAQDTYVIAHISAHHPEALVDIAFANTLSFLKMKPLQRIFNKATRIMTALLSEVNMGIIKGELNLNEQCVVQKLTSSLFTMKKRIMQQERQKDIEISKLLQEQATNITQILAQHGPILESPSLKYTEDTGPCTIFSQHRSLSNTDINEVLKASLTALSGRPYLETKVKSYWSKDVDVEALQTFDSQLHKRAREEKILAKYENYYESSKFKSISFPDEEYSQYLRARTRLRGGSRRLLDSLRVAQDALDEDPRKEMGQLDMTEVIQKMASNSPRTDVFMQNEYLSKSFAWTILFDVSASLKTKGENARALAICVAEATKELLMDPGSWTFYAFSDRFYILKDASEAYSRRVRARIGGLKFNGFTFTPDAIRLAGQIVSQRFDEQRFLIVLSDGWPYGYPDISEKLVDTIHSIERKGVIVIGVGLETDRMKEFFRINCSVYDQKDLIKRFAKIYLQASAASLEN